MKITLLVFQTVITDPSFLPFLRNERRDDFTTFAQLDFYSTHLVRFLKTVLVDVISFFFIRRLFTFILLIRNDAF